MNMYINEMNIKFLFLLLLNFVMPAVKKNLISLEYILFEK